MAKALRPLLDDTDAQEVIQWLAEDFSTLDSLGPVQTALFQYGSRDDDLQADAHGLVQELLRLAR